MSKLRTYGIGQQFEGCLAVRQASLKTAKNRKSYLDLRLSDGDVEAGGKFWDYRGTVPPAGSVVAVAASIELFQDRKQLNVTSLAIAEPGSYNPGLFLPVSPVDLIDLQAQLVDNLGRVAAQPYGNLVGHMLTEAWESFICAPAAVYYHHAYLGGLLHHTVSVADRCLALAVGQDVDLDLLLTGAILHDIGKIQEYTWDGAAFGISDIGSFLGHAIIGVNMIDRAAHDHFPELVGSLELVQLQHLVASHHGQEEWGAGVLPATAEAYLLHQADVMDSNLFQIARAREEAPPGAHWTTDRIKNLGTRVWVGSQG